MLVTIALSSILSSESLLPEKQNIFFYNDHLMKILFVPFRLYESRAVVCITANKTTSNRRYILFRIILKIYPVHSNVIKVKVNTGYKYLSVIHRENAKEYIHFSFSLSLSPLLRYLE